MTTQRELDSLLSLEELKGEYERGMPQSPLGLGEQLVSSGSLRGIESQLPQIDHFQMQQSLNRSEQRLRKQLLGEGSKLREYLSRFPNGPGKIEALEQLEAHIWGLCEQVEKQRSAIVVAAAVDVGALADEIRDELEMTPAYLRWGARFPLFASLPGMGQKLELLAEDIDEAIASSWQRQLKGFEGKILERMGRLLCDVLADLKSWYEGEVAPLREQKEAIKAQLEAQIRKLKQKLRGQHSQEDVAYGRDPSVRRATAEAQSRRPITLLKGDVFSQKLALEQIKQRLHPQSLLASLQVRGLQLSDGSRLRLDQWPAAEASVLVEALLDLVEQKLENYTALQGGFEAEFLNHEELGGDLALALGQLQPMLGAWLDGPEDWEAPGQIAGLIASCEVVGEKSWKQRSGHLDQGSFFAGDDAQAMTYVGIFSGLSPDQLRQIQSCYEAYRRLIAPVEEGLRARDPRLLVEESGQLAWQEHRPMHPSPGGRDLPELWSPSLSGIQATELFYAGLSLGEIQPTSDEPSVFFVGHIREFVGTKAQLLEQLRSHPQAAAELVAALRRRIRKEADTGRLFATLCADRPGLQSLAPDWAGLLLRQLQATGEHPSHNYLS